VNTAAAAAAAADSMLQLRFQPQRLARVVCDCSRFRKSKTIKREHCARHAKRKWRGGGERMQLQHLPRWPCTRSRRAWCAIAATNTTWKTIGARTVDHAVAAVTPARDRAAPRRPHLPCSARSPRSRPAGSRQPQRQQQPMPGTTACAAGHLNSCPTRVTRDGMRRGWRCRALGCAGRGAWCWSERRGEACAAWETWHACMSCCRRRCAREWSASHRPKIRPVRWEGSWECQ
jgi:hypothetical protein